MFTEFDKGFKLTDFKEGHYYVIDNQGVKIDDRKYQTISKCIFSGYIFKNNSSYKASFDDIYEFISGDSEIMDDWSFYEEDFYNIRVKEIKPEDYPEYFI